MSNLETPEVEDFFDEFLDDVPGDNSATITAPLQPADHVETALTDAPPKVAKPEIPLSDRILAFVDEHAPSQVAEEFIAAELTDDEDWIFDALDALVASGALVQTTLRDSHSYRLPPAEQPEPKPEPDQHLPTTDGAKLRALTRARAIDKEISKADSIIAGLKEDLKQAKEEREGYVYELRKCIRDAGQGDLFPDAGETCARCGEPSDALSAGRPGEFCNKLICPDCQRTLTELDELAERVVDIAVDDENLGEELGFTLDDLAYTRKSVREALDEMVTAYGLARVLWTIKPDLPIEKVSAQMVKDWESTLAAAENE